MGWKDYWRVHSTDEAHAKVGTTHTKWSETLAMSDIVLAGMPLGGKALEIGAGWGRMMQAVELCFELVVGVDISESIAQYAADQKIVITNGVDLPFADNTFDFVYSVICFQHMPNITVVRSNVYEIQRVLKPGGMCRVQTVMGAPIDWFDECGDPADGRGRKFSTGSEFACEFAPAMKVVSVQEKIWHDSWAWVTAEKY